jgi:predicted ATP-dependent Lon-type protease
VPPLVEDSIARLIGNEQSRKTGNIQRFHEIIDAMGDKTSTEVYTFNVVETALNQLYDLVKIIRDDLSGTNVYITANSKSISNIISMKTQDYHMHISDLLEKECW